jgi:hypothetical protein
MRPALAPTAAVFAEQLRSVGLSLRREGTLFAALVTTITGAGLYAWLDSPVRSPMTPSAGWLFPAVVIGFFLPFMVWRGESWLGYFEAMPVSRSRHRLLRVAAGLVCLAGVFAVLVGVQLGLIAVTGGFEAPALGPVWYWMIPFAGALILYLLGSALVLTFEMPWAVLAGTLLGYTILVGTLRPGHPVLKATLGVLVGRLGLFTALTGSVATDYDVMPRWDVWLAATALWLTIGILLLLTASHRKRGSDHV